MDDTYAVKRASRKIKRDINKVFSGNFLKIITEIILNSDDSYKRLERQKNDCDALKEIKIELKRGEKKRITVIDYAEGMSAEDFKRIFTEYGAQHNESEEKEVRGLFGQGASDVLFYGAQSAKLGKIESIKDNMFYTCKFIINEEQKVKINTIEKSSQIRNFKTKYNIINNGTVVTFGVGDNVAIPHKNNIQEKIEKFYMLRYVLSDSKRIVTLKHDNKIVVLSSKKYSVLEKKLMLHSETFDFKYDKRVLTCKFEIYEDTKADSEAKVLIIDDGYRVYDETLFGLDEISGASRVKGVLIISHLYEFLNEQLNADSPDEILTDSRDGFDQRVQFTKKLFSLCKPILSKQIEKMNQKYEPQSYILDQDKEIKKALKKINDYYNKLKLEEIGNLEKGSEPPANGVQFVRDKIFITQNKTYDLKLLVNASLVKPNDKITIQVNDKEKLHLVTQTISYKESEIDEQGKVTKSVVLKGKNITDKPIELAAQIFDYKTVTEVSIVEEDIIYPENGIEFIPKESRVKPKKSHMLKLYIDISRFAIGSIVQYHRTSKSELLVEENTVEIKKNDLITPNLAKIIIPFKGGNLGEFHHYKAVCESVTAKALIRVEEPKERNEGLHGLFSGLDAEYDSVASWQSSYIRETGKIKLNLSHVINKGNLKNMTRENLKNLEFSQDQYRYIFELVCFECARQIVNIKLNKNEISDDVNIVLTDIQKIKTSLYKSIFS